jgi:hypothetical protein
VGLPLLSTAILSKRIDLVKRATESRLLLTMVTSIAIGSFTAFFFTLHRYSVGTHGALVQIHPRWSPPGGFMLVTLLYAAGLVLQMWPIAASHLATALPGQDGLSIPQQVEETGLEDDGGLGHGDIETIAVLPPQGPIHSDGAREAVG